MCSGNFWQLKSKTGIDFVFYINLLDALNCVVIARICKSRLWKGCVGKPCEGNMTVIKFPVFQ